jgi:sulfoacetaldehyde dehydrogenase
MNSIPQQIDQLISRARKAQQQISSYDQQQLDNLTYAVGWAVMQPDNNQLLSKQACAETKLGDISHKIQKNHRKTLGLLRDLKKIKSTGVIAENKALGITELARPLGVIGALVPSTNPIATPVNKIINALKCGNSIIVAPSPRGAAVFQKLLSYIHQEFDKIGAPHDLVQSMPSPPTKEATNDLIKKVDLVLVTGSQNNVRAAYSSGTPAIGVGTGNVTTIVDKSADIATTAQKIYQSKTFDNGTSCSSENNIICDVAIYDQLLQQLEKQGGYLLNPQETEKLRQHFWKDGSLNTQLIAQPANVIAKECDIQAPENTTMLLVRGGEIKADNPFCKERMAPILSLFTSENFAQAMDFTEQLLLIQGAGHSLGIHTSTKNDQQIMQLAQKLPTCRVIVNQAHSFATGGSFNNGLPFSLSMGCGSWGGNSIDDNLNVQHYMNRTKIVREIPTNEPTVEEIFSEYFAIQPTK